MKLSLKLTTKKFRATSNQKESKDEVIQVFGLLWVMESFKNPIKVLDTTQEIKCPQVCNHFESTPWSLYIGPTA